MIACLTGVTKAQITSFVLVLEITDRLSAILFMMLSALSAYGIAQLVTRKSFYEVMEDYYIFENRPVKEKSPEPTPDAPGLN